MAGPSFRWVEDPTQFPRRVSDTADGLVISRSGVVEGTRDPILARTAAGLPSRGDAYGAAYPTLVVVSRDIEPFGGSSDSSGGDASGTCRVTVNYGQPGRSSNPPPPAGPDSNFTELRVGSASVPVNWGWFPTDAPDLDDTSPPTVGPLNNGDGATLEVGVLGLEVTAYYDTPAQIPKEQMIRLLTAGALNADAVKLPPIKDTNWAWSILPGQLKYKGFTGPVKREGRAGVTYLEVVHQLELRADWQLFYQLEDERGVPYQSVEATIYRRGAFTGLWGG